MLNFVSLKGKHFRHMYNKYILWIHVLLHKLLYIHVRLNTPSIKNGYI